jgi:hypothetical protein
MSRPSRVVISRASSDRKAVERDVVALLNRHGIEPWYSRDDIPSAAQWESSIRTGLESSDWFLVVLTPAALRSRWVNAEVHWAFEERPGRVIPVLCEGCTWQSLHLMVRAVQLIDLREKSDDARQRLLNTWGVALRSRFQRAGPSASVDWGRTFEWAT